MSTTTRGWVYGVALVLAGSTVWADGFRNPPPTAAGLGRAGAIAAQAEGAEAVLYNAAGMAGLEQAEAGLGVNFARSQTEVRTPMGKATSEDPWQVLPAAFAAWPVRDTGWTAGVGVSTPYGQSAEWDRDGLFRYTAPYFAEMRVVNVNPSVAFRASERVAVGGGLDVLLSTLEFKQVYPWSVSTGMPGLPDGRATFDAEGAGVGAHLGVTWEPVAAHRVALTYRSAVTVEYDGDFELTGMPPAPGPSPFRPKSGFSTEVDFPNIVALGWGVELTDAVRVEAMVEWLDWSRQEELKLDIGRNQPLLPEDTLRYDWEDTWTFQVGADWRVAPEWSLRAGYAFLESPVPDATYTPILSDADRHLLTLGLGFARGAHRVDTALALSFADDREVRDNVNPAYNGTYEVTPDLVGLTYTYTF